MSKAKKQPKAAKGGAKMRDMKPSKDAKGGLLPAVAPIGKSLNFTKGSR